MTKVIMSDRHYYLRKQMDRLNKIRSGSMPELYPDANNGRLSKDNGAKTYQKTFRHYDRYSVI